MSPLLPELRWRGLTRVLVLADQLVAEHWPAAMRSHRMVVRAAWDGSALALALQTLLTQLPAKRWQRVEIYVADKHAHLLRLPAMAADMQTLDLTGQAQQDYARAMLMQIYGESAQRWPLRLQDVRQPQDCIVAAMPALQTDDLRAVMATIAMQYTLQPYATALWAQTRLPANGTVLTAEPQMLRLLQLNDSRITHIASLPADLTAVQPLADWLLRERMLLGVQSQPCYWLMEPDCPWMARTGGHLKQALAGALDWHSLFAKRALTNLEQERMHVA